MLTNCAFGVIFDPMGVLPERVLADAGDIFATAHAQSVGLYNVRITNKGLTPITYSSKTITSQLW